MKQPINGFLGYINYINILMGCGGAGVRVPALVSQGCEFYYLSLGLHTSDLGQVAYLKWASVHSAVK